MQRKNNTTIKLKQFSYCKHYSDRMQYVTHCHLDTLYTDLKSCYIFCCILLYCFFCVVINTLKVNIFTANAD